jgi:hypothetical protein
MLGGGFATLEMTPAEVTTSACADGSEEHSTIIPARMIVVVAYTPQVPVTT